MKGSFWSLHIGGWQPGIGDPTPMGWFTVAMYLVTAFACWRVARRLRARGGATRSEVLVWGGIALMFLALGINKQLDLQSALTEIGRVIAHKQGWYDRRGSVQFYFIEGVAAVCLLVAAALLVMIRRGPAGTWLAALGTIFVLAFVTIRAASFHHFDRFIGRTILGLRWNWILEIGGILIVLVASILRARRPGSQSRIVRGASTRARRGRESDANTLT